MRPRTILIALVLAAAAAVLWFGERLYYREAAKADVSTSVKPDAGTSPASAPGAADTKIKTAPESAAPERSQAAAPGRLPQGSPPIPEPETAARTAGKTTGETGKPSPQPPPDLADQCEPGTEFDAGKGRCVAPPVQLDMQVQDARCRNLPGVVFSTKFQRCIPKVGH